MDWQLVNDRLAKTYHNPRHGNPEEPTDCLFYLMLSRKTPISTAARIFTRLREHVATWDELVVMTESDIAALLAGSGLEATRAGDLRQVAVRLTEEFGKVTLTPLAAWPDADCIQFLCALPGIGMKTALCVLLYGLDRQVFPADAHCIRVLKRVGVIPVHLAHRPAQRELAQLIPPELGYSLHVNLIAHGQQICRPTRPACGLCVIRDQCEYGRSEQLVAAETPAPFNTEQ